MVVKRTNIVLLIMLAFFILIAVGIYALQRPDEDKKAQDLRTKQQQEDAAYARRLEEVKEKSQKYCDENRNLPIADPEQKKACDTFYNK